MAKVMGIVNVTPDSFSDGGLWLDPETAVRHARMLISEGADLIDVGGESTRPGSNETSEATELDRTMPVIEALAGSVGPGGPVEISIDTKKPVVAAAAIAAGATIINDVSASLEAVAASTGAGWVAMHAQGPSATMQDDPHYDDVVDEVSDFLSDAVARGRAAGIERIWVDPGIGFGKSTAHNLELIANLDRFCRLAPVCVGISRKRFVGQLHAVSDTSSDKKFSADLEPDFVTEAADRLEGSLAMATWSAHLGADIVRVHDVRATVHAVRVLNS